MDPHAAEVHTEARFEECPLLVRQRLPTADRINLGFGLAQHLVPDDTHARGLGLPMERLLLALGTEALEMLRREFLLESIAEPLDCRRRGARAVGRLHSHHLLRDAVCLLLILVPRLIDRESLL